MKIKMCVGRVTNKEKKKTFNNMKFIYIKKDEKYCSVSVKFTIE